MTISLRTALDNGYRLIDTAYLYQNEAIIGNVLQEYLSSGKIAREELFITTKVRSIIRPTNGALRKLGSENKCKATFLSTGLVFTAFHLLHVQFLLLHSFIGFSQRRHTTEVRCRPDSGELREGRLRWYGHVLRANDDTVWKIVLNLEVPGKRPRGRPKQCWLDTLHLDLKIDGVHPDQAYDRENWRHHTRRADPATKWDRR
ncbi:unnamed protein product [Heligmosomoides polygyrus]|uniref:NADP-dependent oxidoreductase domain-containing protein n=1 Tax=Heligmosomoides polygyrus TaxID=6339 RepID=A0A3P7XLG3_HELPZ|nr:unnamed protein product [Heligmosomoides polygyrus]